MNKRITGLVLCGTILFTVMTVAMHDGRSFNLHASNDSNSEWVHYKEREATSSLAGVREYWIECGGHYTFTKPSSSNIREATTYDTSEFTSNDPRYIKYIEDKQVAYYSLENGNYVFTDAATLTDGYVGINASTTPGETTRIKFYKDDYSPMYYANCLTASKLISSNDDLASLQALMKEDKADGYYVLTNNLSSPSSAASAATDTFRGTFDGRNHIIDNPSFWGYRMLGRTEGAHIKNLTFNNISIFSVLAFQMAATLVENCYFYTAKTLNQWSNVGLVCDTIYSTTKFKNITIDYRDHYLINPGDGGIMSPLAAWNHTDLENETFENVTIRCLSSINIFHGDYHGRKLRPDEINYVTPHMFVKKGKVNYDIKYVNDESEAKTSAELIAQEFYNATGLIIPMSAVSPDSIYDNSTSSILVGLDDSFLNTGIKKSLPTEDGSYVVQSVGKAVYILSKGQEGYGAGALKFLETLIGFDYIGTNVRTNTIADTQNIDICVHNSYNTASFVYRKVDWSDCTQITGYDAYAAGYNEGYLAYNSYITVPETPGYKNGQQYHTSGQLINYDTYYGTHPKWYGEYTQQFTEKGFLGISSSTVTKSLLCGQYITQTNTGNAISPSYSYTYNWPTHTDGSVNYGGIQLCYTAHGDNGEYQALVNEAASLLINLFINDKNTIRNKICFGIGDSRTHCQCSACNAAVETYGSIAGTTVKFANDLAAILNTPQNLAAMNRDSIKVVIFSYLDYKEAPVKNDQATITADENVKVLFAPIEANFTVSFEEDINSEALTNLQEWSKVGGIYSWLYETNFHNYLFPFNTFESTTKNLKVLHDNGVELAYFQGQHNISSPRTGFTSLKKYLNSKFMLDVNSDYNHYTNKFFMNYYGAGSNKMKTFFDQMVTRLEYIENNASWQSTLYDPNIAYGGGSCYQNITVAEFWGKDLLESWVTLCNEAMALETREVQNTNILVESIFPRFALATLFESSYSSADILALRQQLKADCVKLGITQYSEYGGHLMQNYYDSWGI